MHWFITHWYDFLHLQWELPPAITVKWSNVEPTWMETSLTEEWYFPLVGWGPDHFPFFLNKKTFNILLRWPNSSRKSITYLFIMWGFTPTWDIGRSKRFLTLYMRRNPTRETLCWCRSFVLYFKTPSSLSDLYIESFSFFY